MAKLRGLSLQTRLTLGLVVMLAVVCGAVGVLLARTYDSQLRALAQDRLRQDLPLFKSQLEELKLRDVHLVALVAGNAEVVSGTDAKDRDALDHILGTLRGQTSPAGQYLAVVDPKGQTIATDPFTNVAFGNDLPVREALHGHASLNATTGNNVVFWVRQTYPNLSIEAAWPVRSANKTIGAVVLVNVMGDGTVDAMLNGSAIQAAVVAPQQRALLAASAPLRQQQQQQKLSGWLDNLDQKGGGFWQPVAGGEPYYFVQTDFPSRPAAMKLLFGIPGRELASTAANLRRQIAAVAALAFLVLGALGVLLLRWSLLPLRQLRDGAARIREGTSDIELSKSAPAEIRQIAAALSHMAADLASALEAERGQRSHIEAVIDSMAEGVVVSDVNRRVTSVNPVAKRLLGIDGANGTTTLLPLQPGELAGNANVIKSRSAPIIDVDGRTTGYVTVLHDASEEAELDRLKSEFVGIVSHELRTPLTSIKGSVDLLLDAETGELNPTQRRFLSTIRRSSDRLINLVNDLLDLSRLEAGRVQLDVHPVDARHLVEDTVNNLANLFAAKKQEVHVACDPGLPPIMADRQRMEQLLVNLLGNASKYTPEGGQVCVDAQCAPGAVEISVGDTGPGLSLDDQQRIFERFYRAGDSLTQQQAGSGLGLAIAKSLVELHGGSLSVSSEVGCGSTFTVKMPAYEEED